MFFDVERNHCLLYELGFNALTLVYAGYKEYNQACGHYIAITLTMEAALEILEEYLTEPAYLRLFEAVYHRRRVLTVIDMITKKNVDNLRSSVRYVWFVLK